MRLIMMGMGPFALPTFASLLDSPHELAALVTRPAIVTQTRGKAKSASNPLRELAQSRGIKSLDPSDINAPAATHELAAIGADLFVVCDYGQILSAETLSLAPLGGINLHGSLLPKYRGAAPIQWALWRGEQETGVTVIHMTPGLDAGPCLVQRKTTIGPTETSAELEPRLAQLGVEPVHQAIRMLEAWDRRSPIGTPQDKSQATRAPRLKKSDGCVDWTRSAAEIYQQFRAVQPWPGLFTFLLRPSGDPIRVILERIQLATAEKQGQYPGMLAAIDGQKLLIATASGSLEILRLQPAGGRALDAAEFLRGYRLEPGTRFGTADG